MHQGFSELLGPVFLRELRGTKKSWLSFAAALLLLQSTYLLSYFYLYERSVYEYHKRELHRDLFLFEYDVSTASVRWIGIIVLIPALVAGSFADELQRRTTDILIASPVSSFEIVLKKLTARIVPVLMFLALGAVFAGYIARGRFGIDPIVTIAAYFGATTNVFFMASLTTLVAVGSRKTGEAIIRTYIIALTWFLVPFFTIEIDRDYLHKSSNYLFLCMINRLINPLFVDNWQNINSFKNFSTFNRFILRACYTNLIQLIYGFLFVFWAARRLRPEIQAIDDSTSRWSFYSLIQAGRRRFSFIGVIRARLSLIHPVVWREIVFRRSTGAGRVLISPFLKIVSIAFILYLIYHTICDERFSYASDNGNAIIYSDGEYFFFVRGSTTILISVSIVAATVAAARSFTSEHEHDTWSSLASTPLGAGDVLLGKMAASALGSRLFFSLIAVSWLLGHSVATISRAGALLVFVEILVFHWFFIAMGTLVSLFSKSSVRSIGVATGLLVFFNGGYLLAFLPFMDQGLPDAAYFSGVTPLIEFQSFFPPEHLQPEDYINKNWNRETMIVYGLIFYGAAAAIVTAACFWRYDRYCDRPRRNENPSNDDKKSLWIDLSRLTNFP